MVSYFSWKSPDDFFNSNVGIIINDSQRESKESALPAENPSLHNDVEDDSFDPNDFNYFRKMIRIIDGNTYELTHSKHRNDDSDGHVEIWKVNGEFHRWHWPAHIDHYNPHALEESYHHKDIESFYIDGRYLDSPMKKIVIPGVPYWEGKSPTVASQVADSFVNNKIIGLYAVPEVIYQGALVAHEDLKQKQKSYVAFDTDESIHDDMSNSCVEISKGGALDVIADIGEHRIRIYIEQGVKYLKHAVESVNVDYEKLEMVLLYEDPLALLETQLLIEQDNHSINERIQLKNVYWKTETNQIFPVPPANIKQYLSLDGTVGRISMQGFAIDQRPIDIAKGGFTNANGTYTNFSEAYQIKKEMGLIKEHEFKLTCNWNSAPFLGAEVKGYIEYTDLTSPANAEKSIVPVFSALLPGVSKKIFDRTFMNSIRDSNCTQSMAENSELATKGSTVLLMTYSPVMLYNDKDLHSHPMSPPQVIKSIAKGATYNGGDIKSADGEIIEEEWIKVLKGIYEDSRVWVNTTLNTIHPSREGEVDTLEANNQAPTVTSESDSTGPNPF